jgi:crotonobetainyl-CoA:carnitine CoA-transferase CaiB-like acyl-CoA transferase
MAPHGCYPCLGEDEWVTLAVRDDRDWQAFRGVLGPEFPEVLDENFAGPLARLRRRDELDRIVSLWTSTRGQYQVMEALQAAGVPAGPVLNAKGLLGDPHFRARGFFEAVDHPPQTGLGRREYIGRGWKLSANDLSIRKPAPLLGEDNDYVLQRVLGLSTGDIAAFKASGLIGDAPEGGSAPATVPLDEQVDLGWTVQWDRNFQPR